MARNDEKIILLVTEKLKLLEQFIGVQTQLARKYGWKCSRQETETLRMLAGKLADITKRIDNAIKE
jgi:hypothetical protein